MPIKRLKAWFTSTVANTIINGRYTRFLTKSIPQQSDFEDLFESTAFKTEIGDQAQVDSVGALSVKAGLGIKASNDSAKSGSDTALGSTGGTLFTAPSHLPIVQDSSSQTIKDFTGIPLETVIDATGSNNKFSLRLRTAFITFLTKYLLPTFTGSDAGKIAQINAGSTAYELVAPAFGDRYKTTSSSGLTLGSVSPGYFGNITVPAGLAYTVNQRIFLVDPTNSANFVYAYVTSYSGTTLGIKIDAKGGAGTIPNFNINLAKEPLPDWTSTTTPVYLKAENGVLSLAAVTTGAGGDSYKTTSTTALNMGTATLGNSLTLTVASGLAYTKDQRIELIDAANNANFAFGTVNSYSGTSLNVRIDAKAGSGVPTTLNINLSKDPLPDFALITSKSSLKAQNGVMSWETDGVVSSSNQYYISPGGNDSTGDGSINKPWATFAFAKTQIQAIAIANVATKVTLMVIGGVYQNDVNMAIQGSEIGSGTGIFNYFNYTINCFPGVTITQSTTSFYDNFSIYGHIDMYGSPDLEVGSMGIGSDTLIRIATRRNGAGFTTQWHNYRNISNGFNTSKCVIISGKSGGNGSAGPCLAYFNASTIQSSSSPTMLITGEDVQCSVKASNLTNNVIGGIGIELNAAGQVTIVDTRFSNVTNGREMTAIKVTSAPVLNSTWVSSGNNGFGTKSGYYILNGTSYMKGNNSLFADISGAGDMTDKCIFDNCKYFTNSVASSYFTKGTSNSDKAVYRNNMSAAPISAVIGSVGAPTDLTTGTPAIIAYGTYPSIINGGVSVSNFGYIPMYEF